MQKISDRTKDLFSKAVDAVIDDNKAMVTHHAAINRLKSGDTIKAAVDFFELRIIEAIDASCKSATKRIESRGRQWKACISTIRAETTLHFNKVYDVIGEALKLVNDDAKSLAAPLVEAARERADERVSEWENGWIGDKSKPWRERNPGWWWAFTVLISGLLGFGFTVAKDYIPVKEHASPENGTKHLEGAEIPSVSSVPEVLPVPQN